MKYYVAENGKPAGPYSIEELRAKNITPDTLLWAEGMKEWTAAGSIPEVAAFLLGGAQPVSTLPNGGFAPCNGAVPATPTTPPSYATPTPMKETRPCPKTWLVESIICTICCCLPFGIVGIVKASKVQSKYAQGLYDEAKAASDSAKKWTIWGAVLGLVFNIIYSIFWFSKMSSMMESGAFDAMI